MTVYARPNFYKLWSKNPNIAKIKLYWFRGFPEIEKKSHKATLFVLSKYNNYREGRDYLVMIKGKAYISLLDNLELLYRKYGIEHNKIPYLIYGESGLYASILRLLLDASLISQKDYDDEQLEIKKAVSNNTIKMAVDSLNFLKDGVDALLPWIIL